VVLVLAGCNSPSPSMLGAPMAEVEIAGSRFAVRRSGDRIEAMRLSPELSPNKRATALKAAVAIEQLTGCRIRPGSVSGDQAMVRAELDCAGDKPPVRVTELVVELDCEAGENWRIDGLDQDFTAVDCTLLPLDR